MDWGKEVGCYEGRGWKEESDMEEEEENEEKDGEKGIVVLRKRGKEGGSTEVAEDGRREKER